MEIKPKKIEILPISEPLEEQSTVVPQLILPEIVNIIQEENPLSSIITNELPRLVNEVRSMENILEHCDPITSLDKLKEKLTKLGIRFNTDPKVYLKRDYWLLICILYRTLTYLYDIDPRALIVTEWLNPHSDNYTPSEKLVAETIEGLEGNLSKEILDRIQAVADEAALRLQGDLELSDSLDREVLRLEGLISEEVLARQQADTNLLNTKLDNLTAGDNISITNNVISAVDTVYDDTEVRGLISQVDLAVSDVEDLIPNEATTSNQLADKDFVLNQIATNAANFRGDWANWASVPINANDYPADYTGNKKPNNNDYLIILNATDYSSSNTGIWRFYYQGNWDILGKSGWKPQYRVELAFTPELLNAINSGITSLKVSTYDNYQQQIDNLLPLIYAGL